MSPAAEGQGEREPRQVARRHSRRLALQVLYAADMAEQSQGEVDYAATFEDVALHFDLAPGARAFARELVEGVSVGRARIDAYKCDDLVRVVLHQVKIAHRPYRQTVILHRSADAQAGNRSVENDFILVILLVHLHAAQPHDEQENAEDDNERESADQHIVAFDLHELSSLPFAQLSLRAARARGPWKYS